MPFRLDLRRHGVSQPSHPEGDRARRLTPEGAEAVRALGERLARAGWSPERVLSSPYRRAVETTEVVLGAAVIAAEIQRVPELEPEGHAEDLLRALETYVGAASHALLVGHMPLLGRIADRLTGTAFALKPGELVHLELEGAHGRSGGRLIERFV